MHPAHHHPSTAKVLDEARWLGFQALGAHTAPPKASEKLVVGQATPSKTPVPVATPKKSIMSSSPDFKFRFKAPDSTLTPTARRILNKSKEEDARRPLFAADTFSALPDVTAARKMATPKGKASRYSGAHMAEFKKMDSIANHPSAFRADPNRFKPVNASLKRSPSKAELDKEEPVTKAPNTLKRTQSKMDLTEGKMLPPVSKVVNTPLKRAQSKTDITRSTPGLLRSHSKARLVASPRDVHPDTTGHDVSAKRIKRTKDDDAASTRPAPEDKTASSAHEKTALPLPTSRLMTPTKSSLLRSQSVKSLKTKSMIPSMLRSPSTKTLLPPTNISDTMKEGMREGFRKASSSLNQVRSILRTPSRKFSDDPRKIAAGTHMSPPPVPALDLTKALHNVPATAPVQKHVNFSRSTLEKLAQDELGKSPSPMKFRAGSEVPAGAVFYPKLQAVGNPAVPEAEEAQATTPSRRLTFGGPTAAANMQFSFTAGKPIKFRSASETIRIVEKSEASSVVDAKKRKLETFEEVSDKENNEPAEDEGRSPKKAKMAAPEPLRTPSSKSKLPRRTPKSGPVLSKSRLAFLATPKRSRA
jgi:hypothetical protein